MEVWWRSAEWGASLVRCARLRLLLRRQRLGAARAVGAGSRQALLVGEDLRDVALDPLVVEELAHQYPAVAGVAHLLLQRVRPLLAQLLVLRVQRLLQRLVLQQLGVHRVGLLAAGAEQPAET